MIRDKKSAAAKVALDSIAPTLLNTISPFINQAPALQGALGLVAATLGMAIMYRQERFNQLVQDFLDNPKVYTQEVLRSHDFQDGLVLHLDAYFKLRGEEKLKIARRIFYDFAKSGHMPAYPLERYDDTLAKISDSSIKFLGFIDTDIPNIKEKYLIKKMRRNGNSLDENNLKKMRKAYTDNEPLSTFVNEHIDDEVRKQMEKIKNSETPLFVEKEIKNTLHAKFGLNVSELEQLGIIRSFTYTTPGWDSKTVSGYNLTHYGRMFLSVIKPSEEDKNKRAG